MHRSGHYATQHRPQTLPPVAATAPFRERPPARLPLRATPSALNNLRAAPAPEHLSRHRQSPCPASRSSASAQSRYGCFASSDGVTLRSRAPPVPSLHYASALPERQPLLHPVATHPIEQPPSHPHVTPVVNSLRSARVPAVANASAPIELRSSATLKTAAPRDPRLCALCALCEIVLLIHRTVISHNEQRALHLPVALSHCAATPGT